MGNKNIVRAAFIGSAGVPNRYGGFESFLEFCGPHIAQQITSLDVTCDAALYQDQSEDFRGMRRKFIGIRANGASSIVHDLIAFFRVFGGATHIVVLGVSGAPWFPFFRLLCDVTGKKLLVNVDGVEWRREKFGPAKRRVLKTFDWLAQFFSHVVIYDNEALRHYILPVAQHKAVEIAYSGDHVLRKPGTPRIPGTALTICRIEPENNIEMLIKGALMSSLDRYTFVGNWNSSQYGKDLKEKYRGDTRLELLDPIYDPDKLCALRESCQYYLHGHSVGGTNPSLVEMLFYDCQLLCFDVAYNRATAGDCAQYFSDADTLAKAIQPVPVSEAKRVDVRTRYTGASIARKYVQAMMRK